MKEERPLDLRFRLKRYALSIIRLYSKLPKNVEAQVIGKQFLRAGTSIGAHHREASRARSQAEFVSKMQVGLQELDETDYWLDLLLESGFYPKEQVLPLLQETNELIAILVTMIKNSKNRS